MKIGRIWRRSVPCIGDSVRKRGIGRMLVEACISEAITLELFRVFI
jgi:N-acetylglutamate synthase-like GNAT family acetyltransferase